jgi:hypothetical protein
MIAGETDAPREAVMTIPELSDLSPEEIQDLLDRVEAANKEIASELDPISHQTRQYLQAVLDRGGRLGE